MRKNTIQIPPVVKSDEVVSTPNASVVGDTVVVGASVGAIVVSRTMYWNQRYL